MSADTKSSSLLGRLLALTPPRLDKRIEEIVASMPVPVLWLLGKAQSGKSSIIRAVTGESRIAIGEGFRPCTRASALYAFPSGASPLVKFLDTRGLFEVGYDPTEDIALCESVSHLLVVVVRVNDHAVGPLVALLTDIKTRRPAWRTLLVLSCLHETYPSELRRHPMPYPFGEGGKVVLPSTEGSVPLETREHIDMQRETFREFASAIVPVDLTLPEDGYEPRSYGKDRFLEVAESLLPEVTWQIFKSFTGDELAHAWMRTLQPKIVAYSLAAGSTAAVPIPFIDLPLLAGIHLKMLHSIASTFGERLDRATIAEISAALGIGTVLRLGGREFLKLVPGGSILNSAYVASLTYGLGNAFSAYFTFIREGHKPSAGELRRIYEEKVAFGRSLFVREWNETR